MKQSKLFAKITTENPSNEDSANANFLIRAGFIDKLMAGVYNFLPMGLKVLRKIERITREEMLKIGGEEILLSALQPKENWEQTGRWESFDALFKFQSFYSKINFALGPTHEEVITPLAKKHLFSYRDLPAFLFQFQTKFRDEKRAKSGILRGREFLMKDLYSFHATQKDLVHYYEKVKIAYKNIFERTGVGERTFLTLASGGTFSKYSHEFQILADSGEDKIKICSNCQFATNKEIEDEINACPNCGENNFEEKKTIEAGNIFKLGTGFSEKFSLNYKTKEGLERPIIMGCYGLGITRLMGSIAEVFRDNKGIIWPPSVSPYDIHLLSFQKNKEAKQIYNQLKKEGKEILFDDREKTPGQKMAEADLIGIPWQVIVSEKSLNSGGIEISPRKNKKEKKIVKAKDILEHIKKYEKVI